jgi:hypothetical protein
MGIVTRLSSCPTHINIAIAKSRGKKTRARVKARARSLFCSNSSSSSSVVSVPSKSLLYDGIPETEGHYSSILPSKMGVHYSPMSEDNNIDTAGSMESSSPTETSHKQRRQASRIENARDQAVLTSNGNKCSCNNKRKEQHRRLQVQTKTKVRGKAVSISRLILEEEKWKEDILSRIIKLETKTGCALGLLDLLCHFSRAEINAVWNDLMWLYPDLNKQGPVNIQAYEEALAALQDHVVAS